MRTTTTRSVLGRVSATGVPELSSGAGWSVRKVSTGQYQVSLSPDLRLLYAKVWPVSGAVFQVVVPANNPAGTPNAFNVAASTPATGAFVDGAFWFSAEVAA